MSNFSDKNEKKAFSFQSHYFLLHFILHLLHYFET
jgi:hypothetical protein